MDRGTLFRSCESLFRENREFQVVQVDLARPSPVDHLRKQQEACREGPIAKLSTCLPPRITKSCMSGWKKPDAKVVASKKPAERTRRAVRGGEQPSSPAQLSAALSLETSRISSAYRTSALSISSELHPALRIAMVA